MSLLSFLPIAGATAAAGAIATKAVSGVCEGLAFLDHLANGKEDATAAPSSAEQAGAAEDVPEAGVTDSLSLRLSKVLETLRHAIQKRLAESGLAAEGAWQLRHDGENWRVAGHPQGREVEEALASDPQLAEAFQEARELAVQARQESLGRQLNELDPHDAADSFRWQAFEEERASGADFALSIEPGQTRPVFQAF